MKYGLISTIVTFFSLINVNFVAAETVVSGCNRTYAGKELNLCKYVERISNKSEVVSVAQVDSSGCFSFAINIKEPCQLFIDGDAQRGFFLCYPNKNYQVEIADYRERTIQQKLQPYFVPDEYLVFISDMTKSDANYKVLELEDAMDFYNLKVLKSKYDADTLEFSQNDLKRVFSDFDSDNFLAKYRDYRILLLFNQFTGNDRTPEVCKRLSSLGVGVSNPAFWDVFNSTFNDFVANTVGTEDYFIFKRIIDESNAKMLVSHLREKFKVTDKELLELASIKILADLVQNKDFSTEAVLKLMSEMGPYVSEKNRQLLIDVAYLSSVGMMGSVASDLNCIDKDGNKHTLHEFEGKYIYLNFCNTRLQRCEKDLRILERFAQTFAPNLVVVNVFLYDDLSRIKRVSEVYGKGLQNWYVWGAEDSDLARKVFNARSVPSYFVIDGKGKFMLSRNAEPNDETRYFMLRLFGMAD